MELRPHPPGILPYEIAHWTTTDYIAARQKATLLLERLNQAIATNATEFIIAGDNYLLDTPFLVQNATGLHIIGSGATFWTRQTGMLKFENCSNCTVENLIVDKITYPFVQAEVEEIIPEGGGYEKIIMQLDPDTLIPGVGSTLGRMMCRSVADGEYYSRPFGYGEYPDIETPEGKWIWRRYPWASYNAPSFQLGDTVAMHAWIDAGEASLKVSNCGNMHFIDISIYCASSFQVKEDGIRAPGNNRYTRLKIIPRPDSTRLACSVSDGFHSYNQKIGPFLEDCEIAATYDDGINIHGFLNVVLQKNAPNQYVLASEFGRDYEVGTTLTFYQKPTMTEQMTATVISFEPFDASAGAALLSNAVSFFQSEYSTPIRDHGTTNEFFIVTLDRSVDANAFDLACSPDYCGAGTRIDSLYMHDGCNRGTLIQAPGAIIENSRFENISYGGLYVLGHVGFLEGDFPDGVVIRSNRFTQCAFNSIRTSSSLWASISPLSVVAGTAPNPTAAYLHVVPGSFFTNLTVTGNVFEDSPGIAMFIANTADSVISSNTIIRPLQEDWLCSNLNLSNYIERTYASGIDPAAETDMKSPLYGIYLVSSENVILQDNRVQDAPVVAKGLIGQGAWTSEIYTNVYDDFLSGDLSKWIFTPGDPQRTDPRVVNQTLVWGSSENPAWQYETLVSVQNDFSLTRSSSNPLELSFKLVNLTPRTDADYLDSLNFGWEDADGDVLTVRYSWKAESADNDSAVQFFYNDVRIGSILWNGGYWYESGDIVTVSVSDTGITLYRDRDGTVTTIGTVGFTDSSFAGTGSIYLKVNLQGRGSEFTLDNIR